jgi:NAD(P)-dependent dehydrogenase (short-subunit alcohol dehydrogenase family)
MKLADKVAIVTGAAQGIGAAIARRFAVEGAAVVIADTQHAKGAALAQEIEAAHGRACFVPCDVSASADLDRLIAATADAYGELHVCVCCAGVARVCDFLGTTREDFERVLAVNLTGPFVLGQKAAQKMVAAGHPGAIVNVTSVSAALANPGQESYCASKAGLGGLTRAMAISLARYGIRVNALAPGPTLTDMAADHPQFIKPLLMRTPLGRFAQPDEMAAAALFLASDESSFMTGSTLFVDGGRLALNYTMPEQPQAEASAT